MRRMVDDGTYHMVEFTATRIEDKQEDCWCVLVFTDIHEEYLHEMERNVEMSQPGHCREGSLRDADRSESDEEFILYDGV